MYIKPKSLLRIVGAGPGDPDLITVKGLKALQQADVVLYDALVHPALLEHVPAGARKVYVGKRKGKKEFSQDEINQLIVFYAGHFTNVVRLKGGDPFVFGRGHEELEYAQKRGVCVEVIPGISSSLAAPTSAGIPLTKRGVNESFWVITGTLSSGEISSDIELASRSSATVVILMGITQLEKIAVLFEHNRGTEEPAAIIQYATWPGQKVIHGNIGNIKNKATQHAIEAPAVIVIGKVVDESLLLKTIQQSELTYLQA
jgi:uroporphyrin-III C-methyltransferase